MERRDFLKTTAAAGLAVSLSGTGTAEEAHLSPMAKRPYGKTGERLSLVGLGGIVVMDMEQSEADRTVAEAFDGGVNYFDVAPSYGDGRAEERLGPALQPFRSKVFLACKTEKRDKQGAEDELHTSLKRMRSDHFDLYQLHALSKMEDLERVAGPNGALETFVKAKEKGLIRHIGFSAHSAEVALAALDRFPFDSVLFPFNFVTWHQANFGPQVLAKAKEKGVARLALKALARQPWPKDADHGPYKNCWYQPASDPKEAALALRFTLSQDITAAIPPGEVSMFRLAVNIARNFKPLEADEFKTVAALAQGLTPIFRLSS